MIFGAPLPSQEFLNNYYQGFLFNIPDEKALGKTVQKRMIELPKWFTINKHDRFLDFGGGTGSSYKAAVQLGFDAYYFDLDKKAEEFVKQAHGLTEAYIVNDIASTSLRFDAIFSDNVIEHLIDPVAYIQQMLNLASPGCEIVIKTPHGGNTETWFNPSIWIKGYTLKAFKFNSFARVLSGTLQRFWHCDPPRHLYSFTDKSLRAVATKAGCKNEQIEILYYDIPLFQYTFSAFFFNFKVKNALKHHLIRLVLLPFLPLEWIFKGIHFTLLKIKLLSPGGIVLKIRT